MVAVVTNGCVALFRFCKFSNNSIVVVTSSDLGFLLLIKLHHGLQFVIIICYFKFWYADDEEEYDEVGGGNRFLGFMFGNVDNSGDLDVDYLDEVTNSSHDVILIAFSQLDEKTKWETFAFTKIENFSSHVEYWVILWTHINLGTNIMWQLFINFSDELIVMQFFRRMRNRLSKKKNNKYDFRNTY